MELYVLDRPSSVQLGELDFKLGQIKFTSQFLFVLLENKIKSSVSREFSVPSVPSADELDIANCSLSLIIEQLLSVRGEHKNIVIF